MGTIKTAFASVSTFVSSHTLAGVTIVGGFINLVLFPPVTAGAPEIELSLPQYKTITQTKPETITISIPQKKIRRKFNKKIFRRAYRIPNAGIKKGAKISPIKAATLLLVQSKDVWTKEASTARIFATVISGGYEPKKGKKPEAHGNGHTHYHLKDRKGGHLFCM